MKCYPLLALRPGNRIQACLLVGLAVILSVGCGGVKTYPVSGKLEFEDGSPVMFGTIEFLNRDSKTNARGKISRDGSFTVSTFKENDGAIAGVHEVTIQQFVTVPLTINPDEIEHNHGKHVAEKYMTYEHSDLVVTVEKQSENKVTLVVESRE